MKKLLSYILFFAAMLIAGTGCLKDKGFDAFEYGINDPDTQPVGVGFPEGKNAINVRGINFVSTPQSISFVVSLFGAEPASTDIHVNVVPNQALVTAYNTANGTTLVPLPAGSFNYSGLKVTIPAGQRFGTLTMNIPNATLLSPLASYAMGFTISSVDEAGYIIASNLDDIIIGISVKNKYDGVYTFRATYDHPADRDPLWTRTQFTYPFDVELRTTGPNSVSFWNTAFPATFLPLLTPGLSGYGATALDIVFNPTTNAVVSVNNPAPDARNRQFSLIPGGNSRYDPGSKTVFLEIFMTQNGQLPTPMHIQMIYKRGR